MTTKVAEDLASRRKHRIPPLNPLRFFEVVARTENLTAAARELNVTQSAVSRQIAVLESYVGAELFRRERNGVKLTPAGIEYAARIIPAFHEISNATQRLETGTRRGMLRVRTYTTFAAQWLIPRLHDFHANYPDIKIDLVTGMRDVDFDRDAVDFAIQSGYGDWAGIQADLLFHDRIEPVCSPAYLRDHKGGLDALLGDRLLFSRYSQADWDDWLSNSCEQVQDLATTADRASFSISLLAWKAASKGLGLAIGQIAMLTEEFERQELVRPFANPLRRDSAYYLLRRKQRTDSYKAETFRTWLLECSAHTQTLLERWDAGDTVAPASVP